MPDEHATRARELLHAHASRLAAYHAQKETMTWSAATLYVVAVAVLLGTGRAPFWHQAPWWKFWPFVGLLSLTAFIAFKFVSRQFERRTSAADLVHACGNVLSRWVLKNPEPDACEPVDLAGHGLAPGHAFQLMPRAVVDELEDLRRKRGTTSARPHDEHLTYVLMWAWTAAGLARLLLAWRPFAEALGK